MIIIARGLTGGGKTFLITLLMRVEWKRGAVLNVNYPVRFSEENDRVNRWHTLDELYNIKNGIIGIDEASKLLDAQTWQRLPQSFRDKIRQHRKHNLDIYTTVQDFSDIDVIMRRNVHVLYTCQSLLRWPINDRVKPYFQVIRYYRQVRQLTGNVEKIQWKKPDKRRLVFISRYWTKVYYDTYSDIGMDRFLCSIKYDKKLTDKKGLWLGKIYSRDLVDRGKARM